MSTTEAVEYVKRFSVGNGALRALGCRLEVEESNSGGITIMMFFEKVPDRDDGYLGTWPNVFQHHTHIEAWELDPMVIARFVRRGLKLAMDHEVDESLLFDGKRIFDPHGPTYRP